MSMTVEHTWDTEVMFQLLSPERMSTYLDATHGDLEAAFELYNRNIQSAASFQAMTAMVEVVTRNAIDHALTEWNARKDPHSDWFDLDILDARAHKDIATARQRVRRAGKPETHSTVIAELSFGFWRFLTSKRYHASLWVPVLHQAFPYGDTDLRIRQRDVSRILGNMVFIRNRAAHLEPVFKRNITNDIEQARTLMSWIAPDAALWFTDMLHD